MNKETYLNNPCQTLSIPFWKNKLITLPPNMKIIHEMDFSPDLLSEYDDEPYFRIINYLDKIEIPPLNSNYELVNPSINEYVNHINECYTHIHLTTTIEDLKEYYNHPTYDPTLWFAIKDKNNDKIVGTFIGEFDSDIKEGIIEWVQVSIEYQHQKIGTYLVNLFLSKIKDKALFATVSGQVNNPAKPINLYRRCHFIGNDIWHILTKKESCR